ncbi:MAG: hypothetical protein ACOYJ6_20050 [Caulobacterales bacterium]
MTALARRLANLEVRYAPREAYHVLWPMDGESEEEAWVRQHPGESFPSGPLVIVGWASCDSPSTDQWAAKVKKGP